MKQWWLPGSDEFLAGGFRVWLNAALQLVHMNSLASFAISDTVCCWALDRVYDPPSFPSGIQLAGCGDRYLHFLANLEGSGPSTRVIRFLLEVSCLCEIDVHEITKVG